MSVLFSQLNKITDDMQRRHLFNTVIAALMELSNTLSKFNDTTDTTMAIRQESISDFVECLVGFKADVFLLPENM